MNRTPAKHSVRLLRSGFLAAALIALGAALGFCAEPNNGGSPATYESAVAEAKTSGRPIMLVFTGSDWCIWCKRLENDILHTPEFEKWSKKVVFVEIDFPQMTALPATIAHRNNRLLEKYSNHVSSYPTVLFVDAKGRVLAKTGYVAGGPSNWINNAEQILAAAEQKQSSFQVADSK